MSECTCHKSLWSWIFQAWQIRGQVPLRRGVRAGFQIWARNRRDRHS